MKNFFQELNGNRFNTSDYLTDISNLFNFDNKLSIDQIFSDYISNKFLSSDNLSDNYFTINSDLQDGYYLQDFNLNVNGNYSYNNLNPVNEFLETQTVTIEISRDDLDNLESALQNEGYYDLSKVYDHYLEVEEEYSKALEYVTDEFANLQERATKDFVSHSIY